jgi:hypothetical protein
VVKLVFLRAFTGTTSPACRKYFLTQLALMPLASVNCCPSACPHLLTFLVCVTFRPSRLTQPCLNPDIEIGATIANQFFSGCSPAFRRSGDSCSRAGLWGLSIQGAPLKPS